MKKCARCGETKPFADFPVDARRRDGRYPYCKTCKSEYMSARYATNREREATKDYHARIARRYGITVTEYEALLEQQNGKCAICDADEPWARRTYTKRFGVDHDHVTGEIRGLPLFSLQSGSRAFRR